MTNFSSTGSIDVNTALTSLGTFTSPSSYTVSCTTTVAGSTASQPIFRGFLAGSYVYATGAPPGGATDIVVIGYT